MATKNDNAPKVDNTPKAHDMYLAEFAQLAALIESDSTQNNVIKQLMQCKGDKFTFDGKEFDGIDWTATMASVAARLTKEMRAKNPNAPEVKFSHKTFIVALSKSTSTEGEYYRRLLVAYWQSQIEGIAPKKALYLIASMSESSLIGRMTLEEGLISAVRGIANYILTKEGYTSYRNIFERGKQNAKNLTI